jgi:pimeloyl-ACP methyl ester carboxylesterase
MSWMSKVARYVTTPPALNRAAALTATERLSSVTHLMSSLEYLARDRDRRPGGLNDWEVTQDAIRAKSRLARRALGIVADRRVTAALHVVKVAAAATLLAPTPRKARLAANVVLAGTSAALHPQQTFGSEGSDQVSFVVQAAAGIARIGERRPDVVDACLWFIALQSTMSYAVSGWAKMPNTQWRDGSAIAGVMRTMNYGDPSVWRFLTRHPHLSRLLGGGVLALECLFPAVFLANGRLAKPMVAAAGAFHLANARIMGLGGFLWAFSSMYPALLYAAGRPPHLRDDTLPLASAGVTAGALVPLAMMQARRQRLVRHGRGDEQFFSTTSNNDLAYRLTGSTDSRAPLIVLESAIASSAEHWEWITTNLADRYQVLSYGRAGYGRSAYGGAKTYQIGTAVSDLVELVKAVAGDRVVILVGHSVGGYLVLRAAAELTGRVAAVGLLDAKHPAELRQSDEQAAEAKRQADMFALMPVSMRLGLGSLIERPHWVDHLPEHVRELALAHYRDWRLWTAAKREWAALMAEFESVAGNLPKIDVPALVVTTVRAADEPDRARLQSELADSAPQAECHLMEDIRSGQLLEDVDTAKVIAGLIDDFAQRFHSREGSTDAARTA